LAEVKRVGERSGCDGTGRGGLVGYLTQLASRRPDTYLALLATCLDEPPVVNARSREEFAQAYAEHGFSKQVAYFLWDSRLEMIGDEKGRSKRKPRAGPQRRWD
jgi:hypothetical protein